MRFENSYIPYGAYWSTPFCKWQGSLQSVSAAPLAAQAARHSLATIGLPPNEIHGVTFGTTVPQKHMLYGAPWFAAMIGAERATGTMVAQACATGARTLATAAGEVEAGTDRTMLAVTADRCSNGPHIYYPNPKGPGGTGTKEDWVLDSFGNDPWARNSMLQTAENVAAEAKISREEQDDTTLCRFEQYRKALEDGGAFLRRFMISPFEVKDERGRKTLAVVETDEGVFETTKEGLAELRPVLPDGTVTFGSQTHPADGNCGMLVCGRERAREISSQPELEIRLVSYGEARAKKGFMAMATVPAARTALAEAGTSIADCRVVKTHNPFAVNDVYFAKEMGIAIDSFNNYGSSLIFGHPQGPTGMRLVIEAIEELALLGGGRALFVGCAAGDTAAAVVLEVG